ncbi:hypothetical protein [Legionella cincinnatiensis]|uniref:Secreted protein n=1 Tax=Legionella cincinnatiensis TaxID=28085 RepID=A0A378ILF3_9GAMM|nr:hypothetical protein [Legionella cincinnatiensis]KTC88426.1 hypothetical protein Lcin_1303 [Legionella cincinnatiensis]STX36087.1 Uncharacterised protein [Legionella cincinnatiensis]
MKTVMKSVYLVTALSLSTLTTYADTTTSTPANTNTSTNSGSSPTNTSNTAAPNAEGDYQCQRADPSNNTSTSTLSVTKGNDTYTFEWDDSKGDPILYGTGVMVGSLPNAISVAFWDPKKPDAIGIEVFELKSDGSLQGNWTLQSDNKLGSETCTKSK